MRHRRSIAHTGDLLICVAIEALARSGTVRIVAHDYQAFPPCAVIRDNATRRLSASAMTPRGEDAELDGTAGQR
jgi:hypothetical protein